MFVVITPGLMGVPTCENLHRRSPCNRHIGSGCDGASDTLPHDVFLVRLTRTTALERREVAQ